MGANCFGVIELYGSNLNIGVRGSDLISVVFRYGGLGVDLAR